MEVAGVSPMVGNRLAEPKLKKNKKSRGFMPWKTEVKDEEV